ncbi:MAG: ABC transporter permease [Bacteroidota bacterium]|nr:ABC transporter permease [Bacteroidota bacterium]
MKQLISFTKKEFRHILRDRRTLLIVFAMPVVLVILFGFAITNDIKNAEIAILDNSNDNLSTGIINKLTSSGYFIKVKTLQSNNELQQVFRDGQIKLAVVFPEKFSESYTHNNKAQVQLIADASDLNTATILINYANSIILNYQQDISKSTSNKTLFDTTIKMLYNPEMKSVFMFVPGVLALIMLIVSAMMTAVTLAKEKEMGTFRVLTVSPLKPSTIIIGKVIPYLALSLINACIIIILSMFIFKMPIHGSLFLMFIVCIVFLLTAVSLGIMISSMVDTQQTAIIVSIIGLFLPTILLSGFIFPIDNMPFILQILCQIFPAKWFIEAIKNVMIKGTGIENVWLQILVLNLMTMVFITVSIKKFRQRNA